MKLPIPPEILPILARFPRERQPFSEIAAVQAFKLMGWATATAGIYLLIERSNVFGLKLIPWLLWIFIVWDMAAKLDCDPIVERPEGGTPQLIFTRGYVVRLIFIGALCALTATATIFWLAPLIHQHVLSAR